MPIKTLSTTVEYKAFYDAKNRCTNPNIKRFNDYGGRGIKFCFNNFYDFYKEVGPRPNGFHLDRIDNDGNYEVGNVRWVNRSIS